MTNKLRQLLARLKLAPTQEEKKFLRRQFRAQYFKTYGKHWLRGENW